MISKKALLSLPSDGAESITVVILIALQLIDKVFD